MLSSFIAGLAGVLLAPLFAQTEPTSFTTLLVAAIAAAAFARLTSIPMALLGGLLLGILQGILAGYLPAGQHPRQRVCGRRCRSSCCSSCCCSGRGSGRRPSSTDPLAGVDPPPPGLAAAERSRGPHDRHPDVRRRSSASATVAVSLTALDDVSGSAS